MAPAIEFGLGLLGYHGCWDDAAFAERHGFATAGLRRLAAARRRDVRLHGAGGAATERIRLGPFLAVPSNRSAATSAQGVATVNRLAPGRTSWRSGPATPRATRSACRRCRPASCASTRSRAAACSTAASSSIAKPTSSGRWVRRQLERDYLDLAGRSRSMSPATARRRCGRRRGRRRLGHDAAARGRDGQRRGGLRSLAGAGRAAAGEAGRGSSGPTRCGRTPSACSRPGERPTSPRVLERVGAYAMMPFHSWADDPADRRAPAARRRGPSRALRARGARALPGRRRNATASPIAGICRTCSPGRRRS